MSLSVPINPSPFIGPNGRHINRTSMLVAATIRIEGQALAVRIRNMSETGALIEGPVLPFLHSRIELVRGPLCATGQVTWVDGNRCGVALDRRVEVDCWIPGRIPPHQALVETMIDEAKLDLKGSPEASPAGEPVSAIGQADVAVTEELDAIIASLAALGDRLTGDPLMVAGHGVELQAIDEVQQRLTALKRRLA